MIKTKRFSLRYNMLELGQVKNMAETGKDCYRSKIFKCTVKHATYYYKKGHLIRPIKSYTRALSRVQAPLSSLHARLRLGPMTGVQHHDADLIA